MTHSTRIALAAAALLVSLGAAACGAEPATRTAAPTPTASPAADESLDEAGLGTVHEALLACVRRERTLGIVVTYRDGLAVSDAADAAGRAYDAELTAPNEIARLVDGGQARYVGFRADQAGDVATPNVDVLVFPSETAAATEAARVGEEAGASADQDGAFLTIGESSMPVAASEALAACREQVRPGT